MVKITLSLALLLSGMPAAVAAEQCQESACISVYTDNNQIIIEAHKGSTTVKKTITQAPKKVAVKVAPTPKAIPLFFPPAEAVKPVVKKPTVKRTYKPRIKKAVTKVNLSDRLTTMVPTAGVAYQPEFEPLVNVPVYFWCVTCQHFFKVALTSSVKLLMWHCARHLSGALVMAVFMPRLKTVLLIPTAQSNTHIGNQAPIKSLC